MEISNGGTLTISTCPTSGSAASPSRTSSAMAFSEATSVAPVMATSVTWLRVTSSRMIGLSVSAGNVSMAWTLLVTSSSTRAASAPGSSSAITVPLPSVAVDTIRRTPSTFWMASSMRTTTPVSTSSGAAPR